MKIKESNGLSNKAIIIAAGIALSLSMSMASALTASANHSWGGYHWARTANPFTLKLADNVNSNWDSYLRGASVEWNTVPTTTIAKVLNTAVVAGTANPKTCKAQSGIIQVCNGTYGNNGWLGIAQIWINGSHITQGVTKMNDTYFNTAKYNTPAWKKMVMCQEIAHAFGLDHQDEAFGNVNLGSCMDYTNAPAGGVVGGFNYGASNEGPNLHDFVQLASIYAHLDTFNSYSTTAAVTSLGGNNRSDWGRAVASDHSGKENVFIKDLGKGNAILTHVFWAE